MASSVWQLRHSRVLLAFMVAPTYSANASRCRSNFSGVPMVPRNFCHKARCGLDFSPDQQRPRMRDVAVGADCTDAEGIWLVNGLLIVLLKTVSRISCGHEVQNPSELVSAIPQLKPPRKNNSLNTAEHNQRCKRDRRVRRQRTVQMRRSQHLFRQLAWPGSLMTTPVVNCAARRMILSTWCERHG